MKFFLSQIIVLTFIAITSNPGLAAPFSYSWEFKELAKSHGDQIILRNKNGGILKKINTNQLRYVYAVKSSIEKSAETNVSLILVDGDRPNAFAGKVNGQQNVVGINFAMLELLGMDMHAMAALIGHEIAHLKLNHGESGVQRKFGFQLLKALGTVALGGVGLSNYGAQTISNLSFSMVETKFSRDNESESDYLGMIWAIESGYEADGGIRLHSEMYKASKNKPVPFLSTHPSGPERIRTLTEMKNRLAN